MHNSLFSNSAVGAGQGQGDGTTRTTHLDKIRARLLQSLHINLTQSLEKALGQVLIRPSVTVVSLGEATGDQYLPQQAELMYRIGFAAKKPQAGVIACSHELAVLLVDHLLGCSGDIVRQERPLSEIEVELLRDSMGRLLTAYAGAWQSSLPFSPKNEGAPPEFHKGEPLYVATYEVRTHQGQGQLSIILRLPAWRDALAQVNPPREAPAAAQPNLNGLLGTIGECMLTARALLGNTRITVKELLDLRVGDIICLDRDPEAPLEIRVGNRPKLRGTVRIERGQYIITVEGGVAKGGIHGSK